MYVVDARNFRGQGCIVAKVKFSHDIDEALREQFDEIADQLPGKKNEVVEAMILAFKSLPGPIQEQILSKRQEVRSSALALLAGLAAPSKPAKPARGSAAAKVG